MISNVKQIEVSVIFDGEVFRPQQPLDLQPNTQYLIVVQIPQPENDVNTDGDAWDLLESMIGTVKAPPDWSVEHDHYLYGTPKKSEKPVNEQ
jgi:hypothetical protein